MNRAPPSLAAFVDELAKIAASRGRMHLPKERRGRRSITVAKLLQREKDGTLFKGADAAGSPQPVRGGSSDEPGAAIPPRRHGDVPTRGEIIPAQEKTGAGTTPKKKGDVPTQDDLNAVDRLDGRGEATTVTGLAQRSADIGVSNGEHA